MISKKAEPDKAVCEQLKTTLEELQAADEELLQQNKELAATRQTVETERQRYQELFEFAPDSYLVTDAEGVIQEANRAAVLLLSVSRKFLLGKPLVVFVAEQERQSFHFKLTQLRQVEGVKDWEVRLCPRASEPTDAVLSVSVVRNQEGEPVALRWLLRDITERKRMEVALGRANEALKKEMAERKRQEEQSRLFQSVVLNTHDAVLIVEAEPTVGPGRQILYANKAFTQITGYTLEDVVGKTARILQGPKTDRKQIAKVRAALSNWEPVTVEVINYRKDGSEFWVEFSFVPVADESGRYTHWICVQLDITERKRTEQELRESEERFRATFNQAPVGIAHVGTAGQWLIANQNLCDIVGYTRKELLELTFQDLTYPDDLEPELEYVRQMLAGEIQTYSREKRFIRKDGSYVWIHLTMSLVHEPSGEPKYFIFIVEDITKRKRSEEIRRDLEREKELSQLQLRFFSMASHEFRTPLSTILVSAQVLQHSKDEGRKEKRIRNLQRIEAAAKNMTHLLNDILTINRAETGKLEFSPKNIDLEKFSGNLVEEMQLSASEQHTITFVSEGICKNAYMDEKLLRSILTNLLSNAIKYSPQGGNIHFALVCEQAEAVFCIRDEGIGIPREDQQKLFDPFHRGKNVGTIAGTGLGLTVVKKCVDLHNGRIAVASRVGVGTTSTVILPLNTKHC